LASSGGGARSADEDRPGARLDPDYRTLCGASIMLLLPTELDMRDVSTRSESIRN
jgi:hypothetical protein